MSASTGATTVPSTPHRASAPRLIERPALLDGAGVVTALRRRAVVLLGAIGNPVLVDGWRLVAARDALDRACWLPASAVWSDGETSERPEHPWPVGLATDTSWSRAVLTGLSTRLGCEARLAHERGEALPVLTGIGGTGTVYDGRLGHDVPTVHIVSDNVVRSGAGATVESAYRRALYGDRGVPDEDIVRELADVLLVLGDADLHVATVDLGTTWLRQAGVTRVSVQLMSA